MCVSILTDVLMYVAVTLSQNSASHRHNESALGDWRRQWSDFHICHKREREDAHLCEGLERSCTHDRAQCTDEAGNITHERRWHTSLNSYKSVSLYTTWDEKQGHIYIKHIIKHEVTAQIMDKSGKYLLNVWNICHYWCLLLLFYFMNFLQPCSNVIK